MVRKILKKYWLALVLIIFLLLRLPSLFEPFTYGDEGIYLTLGQGLRKGLVWYREIHDNKPPLLYLLAALAGNFTFYRLLLLIWSFITLIVFHQLAQVIFPKNKTAIRIATAAFALLTSLHCFEGNVANAENFMLLPTLAAFYLIFSLESWTLAGILLGVATLFKVPAAFDLGAVFVFLFLLFLKEKKKNYPLYLKRYLLLGIGFLLPILLTVIYYASQGALSHYLTAAFAQNIPYLASWGGIKTQTGGLPLGLISRSFLLSALIISLFILRKRLSASLKLILIWFGFSLFAALLSSRPYPHYLIQILPSLSLAFGLLALPQQNRLLVKRNLPWALFLVLVLVWLVFRFWYYPNLPYYLNFYSYALSLKDKDQYWTDFDSQSLALYQTADYLKNHTAKEEKIFIWGTQPSLYALADRLPVGRYAASYHIIDFDGYEETIQALEENPPRYMIMTREEKRPFPALEALVKTDYALEKQIDGFRIFHRLF